jgi:hypothetical protein
MTYLLGWSVIPQILIRRERWPGGYKSRAIPLVKRGQDVLPDQPVLRMKQLESIEEVMTIPHLSLPSIMDAPGGDNYYRRNGIAAGDEILPAGLRGRVVDITHRGGVIIESCAAVLQGVIGAGKQVAGVLTMWQGSATVQQGQAAIPPGALLIVPGPVNFAMLRQAMISGVAGVIASSVSSRDLEGFLHVDLVRLIDSVDIDLTQAYLPHITILLTEGLGTLAMPTRTMNLLSHYQGSIALLAGTTSIRQNIFPELVISLPVAEVEQHWQPVQPDPTLKIGVQVRVYSGEYEGAIGIVDYLYSHQQIFSSGIRARSVRLQLENGSSITVPVALIERIS